MDGLTEAYTGGGADASVRRRVAGGGLFLAGVVGAVLGVVVGTTDLLSGVGYGLYESRRVAGVLAGLGVPALLLGVVTVLPGKRRVRLVAAVGAGLAAVAVGWFWLVYPAHWAGYGLDRTLPVSALYLVGLTVTTVALFVGVARFKTRNDPGGTVSLSVLRKGETRIVEVERRGRGSVGLFGSALGPTRGDGGTETATETTERSAADAYCGTCRHLEYATEEGRLVPYCTYHGEELASMDACESWTERRRS
ncbi:hypothetical protein [Halalkalicoccus sp. NIPERK01]|uniref:DUF7139 domain-containing protein n=1 Tax=Halalkalicoccus sp. NIPERK01 TaxID=3053469 RepID=UPI00256EAC25|nr:hypothetical protein [Halalkalicoccus sp. NIPERK01]MDL5361615.1 hypothetical protein [Halalkalicoccus sp. NIPERK01]